MYFTTVKKENLNTQNPLMFYGNDKGALRD
jgi:hypothetical protein